MKLKLSFLAFTMVVAMQVVASPTVQNVTAKQRFPWNGLVDITCKVTGIEKSQPYKFYIEAVQPDKGITNKVAQFWVVQNGTKQSNFKVTTNDEYHLIWDAKADLGAVSCPNMIVCVGLEDGRDKVQLWEGGPYWATTNIGAEKPEDYGYYFWWGDTVGYKRKNQKWVASDGSSSNFLFSEWNVPTVEQNISMLRNEGWVSSNRELARQHDAARVHWGEDWCVPTILELRDLSRKCEWVLTEKECVLGYIVRGRGNYSSYSIFIPCAGYGKSDSFKGLGEELNYWSSSPSKEKDYSLYLRNKGPWTGGIEKDTLGRYFGLPIRPVSRPLRVSVNCKRDGTVH